ncbi:circadian-associated transcriptional repressor [Bombina bombina]|uniref:circadian-associated transcriptional repressor n=1 Tax=Bombina bombina TaxID=8345 RepID=UPI00235AF120|nr:circadian-associated transcriptional repressor [Bombina bombina]XP_053561164.1 circadian-associated transcriptional repressor [Bombina bombina]
MADTDSSDFLSSCDSFYSLGGSSTPSDNQENASYDDFDALHSGLDEAHSTGEVYGNNNLLPNSHLSSTDHPALIRLENEYQARKSYFQQRPSQYCKYLQEMGMISCPSQSKLTGRGSHLDNKKDSDGVKKEVSHGLKRQRKQEADLPTVWWAQRSELNLPKSEGDRIFAQKCQELQGFIKPLTDLLNGLKKGRYDKGLSGFQQSVAMDRIQRIIGVLQKPEMGERYLVTLLQVEMMLKIWFPSVTSTFPSPSSSDYDMEEPQYKIAKHPNNNITEARSCSQNQLLSMGGYLAMKPLETLSSEVELETNCSCCNERMQFLTQWSPMSLTWMHTSPICNPPLSQADLHHISSAIGQDIFGPNTNSCGVILLVPNNMASSTTQLRPASAKLETMLTPDVTHSCSGEAIKVKEPPRCHSAPAFLPFSSQSSMAETGNHSCSFLNLPTCTQRSADENT